MRNYLLQVLAGIAILFCDSVTNARIGFEAPPQNVPPPKGPQRHPLVHLALIITGVFKSSSEEISLEVAKWSLAV